MTAYNSLSTTASSLLSPTLFLIGFISVFPILFIANFYCRYKRYQAASPWTPRGKVVVITGASSGIGEELAYEFARQGATLILCARRADKLAEVANVCKDKYGATNVITYKVDVTLKSDLDRLIENIDVNYDKIDCLVLNAGVSMGDTLEDIEDFNMIKDIMEVNYYGSTMLTYYALPLLKKAEKSRIVVVSSLASVIPFIPMRTGYAASKCALKGFFESLQAELLKDNIFITIAYPVIYFIKIYIKFFFLFFFFY
jgi:short-subunit dehydrogenase